MSTTTSEFIPGMAYEQIMQADFMLAKGKALKALPDEAKQARSALKDAEKRRKGRGYRYLVTVDVPVATFLCRWFNDFLLTEDYSKLSTAQALAMRTVAERFCSFSQQGQAQESKRQTAIQARVARMHAGKERKRQEQEREAQTLREKEAMEAIPQLEADLERWEKEYDKALTAAGKARKLADMHKHMDAADKLQSNMLQGDRRLRKLRSVVA
jgi:hypothetical protein